MKLIPLALALVCLSTSAALADTTSPAKNPNTANVKAEKFDARKQKILDHIAKRISDLQQKQQCAQAATDGKALKACFPNMGKGHHRKDNEKPSNGKL